VLYIPVATEFSFLKAKTFSVLSFMEKLPILSAAGDKLHTLQVRIEATLSVACICLCSIHASMKDGNHDFKYTGDLDMRAGNRLVRYLDRVSAGSLSVILRFEIERHFRV
jgi:hypothetical protein